MKQPEIHRIRQSVCVHALCSLVMLVAIVPTGSVRAQEAAEAPSAPSPTPTPKPTAIPETEIPDRAATVRQLVREAVSRTDVDKDIEVIERAYEAESDHLAGLDTEVRRRMEVEGPASVLEEVNNALLRSSSRLDQWLSTLKGFSTAISDEKVNLENERALWELTRETTREAELPEALRQQVDEALSAIEEGEEAVRTNRDAVLTLQSEVADSKSSVDEMLGAVREEVNRRRRNIIGFDSPPLWRALTRPGLHGAPAEQLEAIWTNNSRVIWDYVSERHERLLRQGTFLGVFIIALVFLRRRAAIWVRQDQSLKTTVDVLDRPIAAALIVTILLTGFFHPRAPRAWLDFVGLVLVLAVLRLLPAMLPRSMRRGAYLFALLYFLHKLTDFAPDGNAVNRVGLFALSLAAAASCHWFYNRIRDPNVELSEGWRRVLTGFVRLAFLAFSVGFIANFFGSVGFATLVIFGTLRSIYAGVMFWVAAVVLRAIVRVELLTKTARSFSLVRSHSDTVRENLFTLIRVVAILGWAGVTLRSFGALETMVDGLMNILDKTVSIGDFSFVPGDIAIFLIVVWLSFKLSRLVRFVLETDVMPRMDLDRGVTGAVSRLSHYAIVVIGFMIGATAAGLDFSRINLIIGALGVGIGFGLQNVVNNFVSGLILLFERPIRVGDKVQLAELSGTVADIGMRASIVRTWQGAEIIVPNANLISSEVTNWTLSDEKRRMELPVGVAYGTDPEMVIRLLVDLAEAHPEVLTDPAPEGLFFGFGASSLDFQLRAWTVGNHVQISSDLLVAANEALVDAGVEIPFPQRDLHLRSVDPGAARSLGGRDTGGYDEAPE